MRTPEDDQTPRGALVPLLAALRCVFWPRSMAGRAEAGALGRALRRCAREYAVSRVPVGENVGAKATLCWSSGWTQTSLNANHGSGGVSNAARMRHLFNGHDPRPYMRMTVRAEDAVSLARRVRAAVAWLTARPLSEVADWRVLRGPGSDVWTPGVFAASAPAGPSAAGEQPVTAVVVAARGRGWSAAALREALLECPRVARLATCAVATEFPLSLDGDAPAARVALLLPRGNARELAEALVGARVGLLKGVSVSARSATEAELAGTVAEPVPGSPLRRVLVAARRLGVVPASVSTSDPADVLATRGLAAFRHEVASSLEGMFESSVDEVHLHLVADWMAARGGRHYTPHAVGPLSRLFFRKTAAALEAVAVGGGTEHMGFNLWKVVLPGPAPAGSQYPRVGWRDVAP